MKTYSLSEITVEPWCCPVRHARRPFRKAEDRSPRTRSLPWASSEAPMLLGARLARLAPGSFLTRPTPAVPGHKLMENSRLCHGDNVLRHLFEKGAF